MSKKIAEVMPEAVGTTEQEPVRVVTPRKPGHYIVRQMSGFPGPTILGEYTDENSWRDAQDKFRSSHGHVELWQIFEGPKGTFRFFISGKKSSGRAAILN